MNQFSGFRCHSSHPQISHRQEGNSKGSLNLGFNFWGGIFTSLQTHTDSHHNLGLLPQTLAVAFFDNIYERTSLHVKRKCVVLGNIYVLTIKMGM